MFTAYTLEDAASLPESFRRFAAEIIAACADKTTLDGSPFRFYRLTMFGNGSNCIEYIDGDGSRQGLPIEIGSQHFSRRLA